jgi:RND family efflux transporter MFP subunit
MRRWVSNAVVLLGGVVLGGGVVALFSASAREGLTDFGKGARRWKAEAPLQAPAPGVIVRALAPTDVPDEVTAWGRLVPDRQAQLAFRVGGTLATRPVQVGDRVRAGDAIATLDATVAAATAREAEALLAQAKSDLARLVNLGDDAVAAERETAATAVAVRTAVLAKAQDALRATKILAPFDGVVAFTGPDAGAQTGPGVPVAGVDQVDPIRLELPLAPHRVPSLRKGMTVRVTVDGLELDGAERQGTLSRIPPRARPGDGLFVCEVLIPNPDGALRAGYVARGVIERGRHAGVVALPRGAVEEDAHGCLRLALLAGTGTPDGGERRIESITLRDVVRLDALVLVRDPGLAGRFAVIAGPRPLPDGSTVRAFAEGSEAEPRVAGSGAGGR